MRKPFSGAVESAVLSAADLGITAAANWAITACDAVAAGPMRHLHMAWTYSGATITGSAVGNIADVTLTGIALPAGWRPARPAPAAWDNGAAWGTVAVTAAGTISLRTMHVGATLASGDLVIFAATYRAV